VRLNDKPVRRYTAALLTTLLLAAPAGAQTASVAAARAAAVNISRIRIDNFGRINDKYFRGAQPEGRDYADLAASGIKAVVNLTSDDAQTNESAMARRAGMKYFQIPMTTHQPPTAAQLIQFLSIVNDPVNQPVYVHCVGGRHRTGVMTAVYRMAQDRWSPAQAFNEMKKYKFGFDFMHPEFKDFVFAYPAQAARAVAAQAVAEVQPKSGR